MQIRLGTRPSALALWQATHIANLLIALGHEVELVKITTSGDVSTTSLGQSSVPGVFTKEIQRALIDHRCDLAVHSLKDLPTDDVAGLTLAAIPPRETVCDCLVSRLGKWCELPHAARIGTGSPRRKAQLLRNRPDLQILDIRGNVDTRLRKLDDLQYDAIVLAFAGVHRLGLDDRITECLPQEWMLPAVGQGALGLEMRIGETELANAVMRLDDPMSHAAVVAERSLLRTMRAGCLAPLAAHAHFQSNELILQAKVMSIDGKECIEGEASAQELDCSHSQGLYAHADRLGKTLANQLKSQGADRLIADSRQQQTIVET